MNNKKQIFSFVILSLLIFGGWLILNSKIFHSTQTEYVPTAKESKQNQSDETEFIQQPVGNPLKLNKSLKDNETPIDDRLSDEYLAYIAPFKTREKFRQFVHDATNLNDAAKAEQSAELEVEIAELQQDKKISQAEYLMLQVALIRLSNEAETAKQKSKLLTEQYKQLADARNDAFINNPSPQFKDYKTREKAIVAEIMSMSVFPDGMTREAYLAKRLAEARDAAYHQ